MKNWLKSRNYPRIAVISFLCFSSGILSGFYLFRDSEVQAFLVGAASAVLYMAINFLFQDEMEELAKRIIQFFFGKWEE